MSSNSTKGQCWRCKATKDPNWAFCPGCGARLKETRNPSLPNPALDIAFLYDIYSFGWYSCHISAVALYEAAEAIDHLYAPVEVKELFRLEVEPPYTQSILRTKIFAEYVVQLETLSILCLAITKRKQQSIM